MSGSNVTRRSFLKKSSVGAAALGLASAVPSLVHAEQQAEQARPSLPTGGPAPAPAPAISGPLGSAPFVVYVSDPSSGSGSVLIGEEERPFNDPRLIQALQQIKA